MKRINYLLFIFLSIILIAVSNSARAQYKNLKQNLAIIDFENRTTFEGIGTGVQDILTTILWKSDRFILIEREKIREILQEQDFSYSGRVSVETAIEIGRILGADYILTGGITEAGLIKEKGVTVARIALDARLINVTSTQIIFAETAFGKEQGTDINTAIRAAAEDLVAKVTEAVDKKPWQSLVMKVDGQNIYINAGAEHGIQKGNKFVVHKQGEELVDPKTQVIVGYLSKKIGVIKIIELQPKYSIAAIIEGAGFEKGDIVKKE